MLVVIPARGGSKGVPRKNIKPLNGKPLIQYTLDTARQIFKDDDIIVSTDDEEIKNYVQSQGLKVPFLRPQELASDKTGMHEVLLHALSFMENRGKKYKTLVLLQPTSPFRKPNHITEALKVYKTASEVDMVVSVKESASNPYYVLKEEDDNGYLKSSKEGSFVRRQDCPKVWELNGAVYIINTSSLKKCSMIKFDKVKKYEMDAFSSHDIDEPWDWKLAEFMMREMKSI